MTPVRCPFCGSPNTSAIKRSGALRAARCADCGGTGPEAVSASAAVQLFRHRARSCPGCGCTELSACKEGCSWVPGSLYCSCCLSAAERRLVEALQ